MENKMNAATKTLLCVLLVIACLLIATFYITGCSRAETENSTALPQSTQNTITAGDSATEKPITQNAVITEETASQVAFSHAGVPRENAQRVKLRLDCEDGKQVYEIEFYFDGYEYEYDVDSKTGEILRFEKEPKHAY